MNFLKKFFKSLFGNSRPEKIVIIDPENLHQVNADKARSKNYHKYKKTYYYGQSGGTNLIEAQKKFRERGRYVKYWRLVTSAFDFSMDEYIPIFYNKKKNRNKGHKGKGNKSAQRKRAKIRKKNE